MTILPSVTGYYRGQKILIFKDNNHTVTKCCFYINASKHFPFSKKNASIFVQKNY